MAYRSGIGELDARLVAARAAVETRARLARMHASTFNERERLAAEHARLQEVLAGEQKDVEGLEGVTVTSLFYRILGRREDKLDQERAELLRAHLKAELVGAELIAVDEQLAEIDRQYAQNEGAEEELARCRAQKEAWLTAQEGPAAEGLFKLAEETGRQQALLRDLDEAIAHGKLALHLLDQVLELLGSAGNWGTYDLLGGGLLATAMKHGKIDDARSAQAQAQNALLLFQRELRDVEVQLDAGIELTSFSRFGDYFFDGLIVDWSVQSQIREAQHSVERTRAQVAELLDTLDGQRTTLDQQIKSLGRERTRFVEGWAG